jgi:hypothetical protein
VATLQRTVGSSVVGFGTGSCLNILVPQMGILQEANDAYGIRELAAYDPMIPRAYDGAFRAMTGRSPFVFASTFCPGITNADIARRFGVAYVLVPSGSPAPAGTTFVRQIGDEDLYRVPGSSRATTTPVGNAGTLPPPGAPGDPVAVDQTGPASLRLRVTAPVAEVLRVRLTNVPGWHATIDGRPLSLRAYDQVMVQAMVPPGQHTITLAYWPLTFTVGIVVCAAAVVGIVAVVLVARHRHRAPSRRGGPGIGAPAGG